MAVGGISGSQVSDPIKEHQERSAKVGARYAPEFNVVEVPTALSANPIRCKVMTTHSPMTPTAIQSCRPVSTADRSLHWRRLHKKVPGNPKSIRAGLETAINPL